MAYPPHLSPGEVREWLREQDRQKRLRRQYEDDAQRERQLRIQLLEQHLAPKTEPRPEPERVKPAKASSKTGTLSGPVIEAYLAQALRECHKYEDGEVGNYENEISHGAISRELAEKYGVKLGTVKSAVTNALKRMFPGKATKSGLTTYRLYREGRMLGRWFRDRFGDAPSYGTIGDLEDLAEQELHRRVVSDS